MPRYAMVVDTKLCVSCKACVLACKAENRVPDGFSRDWLVEEVRGVFPTLRMQNRSERCNHCGHPPCVSACPTGASHVGEGGTVLVTHGKCTGCKACIAACPYDARFVHPAGYIDKCTFCLHRVQRGKQPACVAVCPTYCLHFGDLDDPGSEVAVLLRSRKFKVLHPETGCDPHLYFLE
ncbi:MAG: 4Fe-4S dicluster domain-containing protein [Myxococcota bacterium]|jgi:Fe-S-cluster-containing dehydrogenase component|nr:4Fe-4S dicluster domain-containing protein [Myxococcota bacterium]